MRKILIANRGEIACRIIRTCQGLGLSAVAVYSDADVGALHVLRADEAYHLGGAKAEDSYLAIDKLIAAARDSGADAVHPGYGFLAESAPFARAVSDAGLIWVGLRPNTIGDMGDKERARLLAKAAGVPILLGSSRFGHCDLGGVEKEAAAVGYPLLVKASAGGGGIGMQRVDNSNQLHKTIDATQKLAERIFGDSTIFFERFVPRARHIEIQVFGFGDGRAIHFYERECSIQRRFQKIIEESPSPALDEATRTAMAQAAVAIARQERNRGAGTIEFVFDEGASDFFFLEMNTRIQVEHPVTEMLTGFDPVELQLRLAADEDLSHLTQETVNAAGHAIECRIYAENPAKNFLPSPGTLSSLSLPDQAEGLRVDAGVREGDRVTPYYDPLIAKVVSWGEERELAILRMRGALEQICVDGLYTNVPFLICVLGHEDFATGRTYTSFVDDHGAELLEERQPIPQRP